MQSILKSSYCKEVHSKSLAVTLFDDPYPIAHSLSIAIINLLLLSPTVSEILAYELGAMRRLMTIRNVKIQESRAVAGNPRDAAVIFDP